MRSLDEIAIEAGTDKSSVYHDYAATYDEFFGHLRSHPCKILEFGVLRGDSLRMWLAGFSAAEVHGADIDLSNTSIQDPRLTLHLVDGAKSSDVRRICEEHGPFDIVIEDALHRVHVTRPIVETAFPDYVKPGGWIVIEDTNSGWSTKKKGDRIVPRGNDALHNYAKSMVDAVNRHRWIGRTLDIWPEVSKFDASIRQVIYRPKLCMIQRKP